MVTSDLIYDGNERYSIDFDDFEKKITENHSFREFTITATAPSKTFNLAGLQQSNIFIPNQKLQSRFREEYNISGLDEPNLMGIAAAQAAYEHGDEWFTDVRSYIENNIQMAAEFIRTRMPGVKLCEPEGTYLIWLDMRDCGLTAEELDRQVFIIMGTP